MSKQIKNIFSDSACPSQETMFRYMDNLLKGEEKHAFERHLAGCSLCADAFDGLSMMSESEAKEDIAALHSMIENQYLKTESGSYWAWAVAASVSMLLIAGSWAYLHQNNEATVAKETKIVVPEADPGVQPSASVAVESRMDSIATEPADKTIALSNDAGEQKNISSDAGIIIPSKPEQKVFLKSDQSQEETVAPKLSTNENAKTVAPSAGAGFQSIPSTDMEIVEQKRSSNDDDLIKPSSPGIASQMLAYEESIISGNTEVQKETVSISSTVTNKAANSPAAARYRSAEVSPQPVMKEEDKKKTKTMPGCKNCPDKKISQGAALDMQELTFDYAVKKFNEKSYSEAHLKFTQLINENPVSDYAGSARLYDAICLVYQNKPDEAMARLKELEADKEYSDDAKWLKAAIFIDQNKSKDAEDLLKELEKNKVYKEKAAKTRESLR